MAAYVRKGDVLECISPDYTIEQLLEISAKSSTILEESVTEEPVAEEPVAEVTEQPVEATIVPVVSNK